MQPETAVVPGVLGPGEGELQLVGPTHNLWSGPFTSLRSATLPLIPQAPRGPEEADVLFVPTYASQSLTWFKTCKSSKSLFLPIVAHGAVISIPREAL